MKKQIYADLKIPEYWVIDVRGERVLAFGLEEDGKYRQREGAMGLRKFADILARDDAQTARSGI